MTNGTLCAVCFFRGRGIGRNVRSADETAVQSLPFFRRTLRASSRAAGEGLYSVRVTIANGHRTRLFPRIPRSDEQWFSPGTSAFLSRRAFSQAKKPRPRPTSRPLRFRYDTGEKIEKTMFFPEAERQRDKENCTDRSPRGRDSKGRARLELFSQKQVFGKMGRQRLPLVPLSR